MNVFNRIVMVLTILIVFLIVTIGLFVPAESLTVVKGALDNTLHTLSRIRPEFILPFRALLILCAVLVDALLILLLRLEFRGPARHTIRVTRVGGGEVAVTTESLVGQLQYHLDQLANVLNVKVEATPRGGAVDLELNIQTGDDVNIPEKAEQVLEVARQVIEGKMGLKLARKPRVNIHVMPTPGQAARPTAPTSAVTTFHPTSPDKPASP